MFGYPVHGFERVRFFSGVVDHCSLYIVTFILGFLASDRNPLCSVGL